MHRPITLCDKLAGFKRPIEVVFLNAGQCLLPGPAGMCDGRCRRQADDRWICNSIYPNI